MSTHRVLNVLVAVALIVVAALTAWEVAAITDVVPDDRSASAAAIGTPDTPLSRAPLAPAPAHRAPIDECFDVSLSEVAECRRAIQSLDLPLGRAPLAPAPAHRAPIDECFDVSLSELAECRRAIQALDLPLSRAPLAPAPAHRAPIDECFDVSLSELAECRLTSRTPASSWMPTPTPPPSAG